MTQSDAVRLAAELYGLQATAESLPSERDQNFLLDTGAILEFESPPRPRLGVELLDMVRPAATDDIGRVILRAEFKAAGGGFDPSIKSVH